MRMYGKRFMANRTEGRINDRKESRDAVVYDISEIYRYCRVRVSGTSMLVRAWFPNNFMRSPQWLKVGAAVRVSHVGGDKSRIEVVSPGLIQPTQAAIPMSGGVDTILSGMYPSAPIDGTGWTVEVSEGTYRINGVAYAFAPGGPTMDNENWHLGDGGEMSGDYWWGSVDPMETHDPDELWFRYDAFAIGSDGVVDYLKGDEWMWEVGGSGPTKPSIPADHVLIRNYILLWSGTTSITQKNIGAEWEAPRPDHLDVTYYYPDPAYETDTGWARATEGVGIIKGGPDVYAPAAPGSPKRGAVGGDMEATVTVTVKDQYDQPYGWWTSGSLNQLSIRKLGSALYGGYGAMDTGLGGPGSVPELADESGYGEPVVVNLGLGSSYGFYYTRQSTQVAQSDPLLDGYPSYYEGDSDSHSALFEVTLLSDEIIHPVSTIVTVQNLDSNGNIS